jgi:hypothetical protein
MVNSMRVMKYGFKQYAENVMRKEDIKMNLVIGRLSIAVENLNCMIKK